MSREEVCYSRADSGRVQVDCSQSAIARVKSGLVHTHSTFVKLPQLTGGANPSGIHRCYKTVMQIRREVDSGLGI